jgi:hypothetical protein
MERHITALWAPGMDSRGEGFTAQQKRRWISGSAGSTRVNDVKAFAVAGWGSCHKRHESEGGVYFGFPHRRHTWLCWAALTPKSNSQSQPQRPRTTLNTDVICPLIILLFLQW